MKTQEASEATTPRKPILPIDIHYNKLLDWLVDRRHCNVNWATDAVVIRGKINAALSVSSEDVPENPALTELLTVAHPNFFHARRIVEILSETEKEKKNFLGQCTSPIWNAWSEVMKHYQKNGVFLAEAAQQLIRFVNYEIAALKKTLDKNKKMVKECQRKEADYDAQVSQIEETYKSKCRRLDIQGVDVRSELRAKLTDLPGIYDAIADDCRRLADPLKFYEAFLDFLLVDDEGIVPILKHFHEKGNTTVFEFRTGLRPSRVVASTAEEDKAAETAAAEEDIDWGDIDFDADVEDSTTAAPEASEVAWETTEGSEIDWSAMEVAEAASGVDALHIEIVDDSKARGDDDERNVAVGKDALTLLENPETRFSFLDELMEISSFLLQRLAEIRREDDILSVNQFQNSPLILQTADEKKVESHLGLVSRVIERLRSEKVVQLGLIKANPRALDRLVEGVTQYSSLADRMRRNRDHVALRRREAEDENRDLLPRIDELRRKTKELQKNIEGEISRKYEDRPVNIMGEINLI